MTDDARRAEWSEPESAEILGVEVVPEICMRFQNCTRIATRAFGINRETGKSSPKRWQEVDPAALWKAARSCPSGAIRLITADGYIVPRWKEAADWDTSQHPAAGRPHEPVKS